MRKGILFSLIFTIIVSFCSLTSCNFGKEEPKEEQKVETINPTNNFTELVWKINEHVMANYPTFGFYEAFAYTADYDSTNYGVVDPVTMRVVYGDTESMTTVMAYVDDNWNVCYDVVDEPWLEDEFTTPYVPMGLEDALRMIQEKIDIVYGPGTIAVLRHQLYYKEAEPRFFIGSLYALHTVNVYTGEIDAQLAEVSEALSDSFVYAVNDVVEEIVSDTVQEAESVEEEQVQ